MNRSKVLTISTLMALTAVLLSLPGCGGSGGSSGETKLNLQPASTEYPNPNLLVSEASLQSNLGLGDLVVIDARSKTLYDAGHIPGAITLLHNAFWTWGNGLKPVAELQTLLGTAGLTRTKTYVIYDNTTDSWGAAGRIFWMLEYLGCTKVHILNGGWDKWIADGRPTQTASTTLPPATFTANVNAAVRSTKESIRSRMAASDFAIIDARADEEFIGWQLYGEARGGHIPGATHIPYHWFYNTDKTVLSYTNLKNLFESRGITSNKEVASHCTVGIRSGFVYFALRLMGHTRASNYDASIIDWAAADGTTYPMEKMANHQGLVYPQWVQDLINGGNPATYPGNGYVILYTTWTARYAENRTDYVGTNYATGHIPGAIFLDTYSIENGPNSEYGAGYAHPSEGNVKPILELQAFFGSMGISKDKTVVVYADDEIAMMTAGRVAWALLLAGVNDVRILNGGYQAWVQNGGAVETTPRPWTPVAFGSSTGNPQYLATMADVQSVVNGTTPNTDIADDRSWDEYIGASNSYYPYFSAVGRIPTSHWIGDWGEIVRGDSQSLRSYTEVLARWTQAGFTASRKMYFYCGTGWRSGLYTFYAYLLGWPAANYDGGWFEWSYYPENPKVTGTP
jgi:3-mercaptopyruvate sulfurtransferase SseA